MLWTGGCHVGKQPQAQSNKHDFSESQPPSSLPSAVHGVPLLKSSPTCRSCVIIPDFSLVHFQFLSYPSLSNFLSLSRLSHTIQAQTLPTLLLPLSPFPFTRTLIWQNSSWTIFLGGLPLPFSFHLVPQTSAPLHFWRRKAQLTHSLRPHVAFRVRTSDQASCLSCHLHLQMIRWRPDQTILQGIWTEFAAELWDNASSEWLVEERKTGWRNKKWGMKVSPGGTRISRYGGRFTWSQKALSNIKTAVSMCMLATLKWEKLISS